MKGIKIGYETGSSRANEMIPIIKQLIPTLQSEFVRRDCFYDMTPDKLPIFEKKGNKIFASGLCGRGFKFMPMYGPILYDMLNDPDGPARIKL